MNPNDVTECHLLLAVLNEYWDAADAHLAKLSANDRKALAEAVRNVRTALVDGRFDRSGSPAPMERALAKPA